MADFQVLGDITNIRFKDECILIWVDEYKKGYRKSDGTVVDDKVLSWKCIFSGNEKKRTYVNKFFNRGSLVQIKGEVLPYSIENGTIHDGEYSVLVQTLNLTCYPRQTMKAEARMIKDSQSASFEKPDLDGFMKSDF